VDTQQPQPKSTPVESAADASSSSPSIEVGNSNYRLLVLALLLATFVWLIGWHVTAAFSMAAIWWHSETFAHGLVIYPVTAWLVWRKRRELATLPLKSCYSALLPLAAASVVALLGDVAGVQAAHQFGLVAMTALAVVTIAGSAISRVIAFPLAFTLLAVPIGEFLLPVLMQYTADFTVAALRLSGVPVYREGLFFTVPTGRWSVVEACSGLRYLIASFTLGLLYAYLTYRSLWRRLLFVCASIVVPIVANWLRAYMIVMIGHLSDMRYAVGVDHLTPFPDLDRSR
jgi:exosortase A